MSGEDGLVAEWKWIVGPICKGKLDRWNRSLLEEHECIFGGESFLEDVLLVEVIDYLEVVRCQIAKVDEGTLELPDRFVVEVYFRLRDRSHVALSPSQAEGLHFFTL